MMKDHNKNSFVERALARLLPLSQLLSLGRLIPLGIFAVAALLVSGCFWITSPFNGPTVSYPTSEVEAIAWTPDGSRCVSLERHAQSAASGSSYVLASYDRSGAQISSIALAQDQYPYGSLFVDPANAFVYFSNGSAVERMSLSTGLTSTLVYSYHAVAQSVSGKYLLLTNESAQDPHSFELLDLSGTRPRPVHQWAVSLASTANSRIAWLGDSVLGYLGYNQTSALSLFVVDTNIQKHDSLNTSNDLDALYANVLGGGGYFYLASRLGITRLSSGSAGTVVVEDTAAVSSISSDGRVIAYCTEQYRSSTLRLLNPLSGKTSTISSSARQPKLSPSGDRIAFTEDSDFFHSSVRILPVQIP